MAAVANSNFGNALQNFLKNLGEQELAVAAVPLRNALGSISSNPSPSNVAAQGAVLAVALPAALPNAEAVAAQALATEGKALLDRFAPPSPAA